MPTLFEKLTSYICSDELTDEQRAICEETGSFVVRACPGSGKTRTVGTRLALRIANWNSRRSGIAALSFTNVAWQEIGRYLHDVLGLPSTLPHPHFLGTIDSFVNRFLLSPFGHVVMGCARRPEVVHPQSPRYFFVQDLQQRHLGGCMQKGCRPTSFSYSSDGQLQWLDERKQPKCNSKWCSSMKQLMVRPGYALPTDAMYWGMKLVCEIPGIASVVARRFPEIIVDEAQDTTETQFLILDALSQAGSHVVVVGDPDQAIFEFSGGRPDRFVQIEACSTALTLSKNFRSSQRICNATNLLSEQRVDAAEAAGPDRDFPAQPTLITFDPEQPSILLDQFTRLLDSHSIALESSAVLCRTHRLVALFAGPGGRDWPGGVTKLGRMFAQAAAYRENGELDRAHHQVIGALSQVVFGQVKSISYLRDQGELRTWKRLGYELLKKLPPAETPLDQWGPLVRSTVQEFVRNTDLSCHLNLSQQLRKTSAGGSHYPVSSFVKTPRHRAGMTFKVIHQVKGETYDAVMVVAGPGRGKRPGDLIQWLSDDGSFPEERRVGYVATTRPRKLLVLAVPLSAPGHLVEKLLPYFVVAD